MTEVQVTDAHQLSELREIILEPSFKKFDEIDLRIEQLAGEINRSVNSDSISYILPQAFEKSLKKNESMIHIFQPVIEKVIERSIENDKKKMIEILFPIIGATIKRSVAETFRSWIQSFETVVERSFTLEGLKWRLESKKTGISVGEIAFNRSLIFRVEHIFLIHKASVKILCHVYRPGSIDTDSTLLAGMIDAVSNFIRDVFITNEKSQLETLVFGNYKAWFSNSESAVLVSIIRGEPSSELKIKLQDILSEIQFEKEEELKSTAVDEQSFLELEPLIGKALDERKKDENSKSSTLKIVAGTVLGLLLVFTGIAALRWVNSYVFEKRFDLLLDAVRSQKGVYLVDYGKTKVRTGFITTFSEDPKTTQANIVKAAKDLKLTESSVTFHVIDYAIFQNTGRTKKTQQFEDGINSVNGIALTKNMHIDSKAIEKIVNTFEQNYFLGKELRISFIGTINYTNSNMKNQADSISGLLRYMLEKRGVLDFHLIRTLENKTVKEMTLYVKQEKSKFNQSVNE